MSEAIRFRLENFERDGDESVNELVTFGPESDLIQFLITFDPIGGGLSLTVGNGPETEFIPESVPTVLREVADIVEDLSNSPEFWMSVGAHNALNKQ